MKILILSDDFPPEVAGGAGMMAFRTAQAFMQSGHDVRVFCATSQAQNTTSNTAMHDGLVVTRFHSTYHERWRSWVSLWNPVAIRELKRIIEEFKPDVVHAHNVHAHISYAALMVAKKKVPKVYMTAHDIALFFCHLGSFSASRRFYCLVRALRGREPFT
jgi:glycosyltransferase involved in cell wall biosynthesis